MVGREGIGKSTVATTFASWVTRGEIRGIYYGTPKPVIIAATEDSWEYTIVPRLLAARADLDLVYRVKVTVVDGLETTLVLPSDLGALEDQARQVGAAFVLLDPLLSRLDAALDSYNDAEVRQALEPLAAVAERLTAAFLGVAHVNKTSGTDPLNAIMGSRAFGQWPVLCYSPCVPPTTNSRGVTC